MAQLARAESGHEEILKKFESNIARDFEKSVLWGVGSDPHTRIGPELRDSIYRVHRKDTKSDKSGGEEVQRFHERGNSKSRTRGEFTGRSSNARVECSESCSNNSGKCPTERCRERSCSPTPSRKRSRPSNSSESDPKLNNTRISTSQQEQWSSRSKEKRHCAISGSNQKRHEREDSAEINQKVSKCPRSRDPRHLHSRDRSVTCPVSHSRASTSKRKLSAEELTPAAKAPVKSEVAECKHASDILCVVPAQSATRVDSEKMASIRELTSLCTTGDNGDIFKNQPVDSLSRAKCQSVDHRFFLTLLKAKIIEGLTKGKHLQIASEPLSSIFSDAPARETNAKSASKPVGSVTDTKPANPSLFQSSRSDAASETALPGKRSSPPSLIDSDANKTERNEITPNAVRSQKPSHYRSAPVTTGSEEFSRSSKAHAIDRLSQLQSTRDTAKIEDGVHPPADTANICLRNRERIGTISPYESPPIRAEAATTADCKQADSFTTHTSNDATIIARRTLETPSFLNEEAVAQKHEVTDRKSGDHVVSHTRTPAGKVTKVVQDESSVTEHGVESEQGHIKPGRISVEGGEIAVEECETTVQESKTAAEENEIVVEQGEIAAEESASTVEERRRTVEENEIVVEEGEITTEDRDHRAHRRVSAHSKTSKNRPRRGATSKPHRRASNAKPLDRYGAPIPDTGAKRHERYGKPNQMKKHIVEKYSRISTQITTRADRGSCGSYYSADSYGENQYYRDVRDYVARAYTNRTTCPTGEPYYPPQFHSVGNYEGYPRRYEGYC